MHLSHSVEDITPSGNSVLLTINRMFTTHVSYRVDLNISAIKNSVNNDSDSHSAVSKSGVEAWLTSYSVKHAQRD
jgi:hypothetical protein